MQLFKDLFTIVKNDESVVKNLLLYLRDANIINENGRQLLAQATCDLNELLIKKINEVDGDVKVSNWISQKIKKHIQSV